MQQQLIPETCNDLRLDRAVAQLFPEHSRTQLTEWIKQGVILLNQETKRPKDKVKTDDLLSFQIPAPVTTSHWQAENMDLDILYEDDALLLINKPANCVVHPGAGQSKGTLANGLLAYAPELSALPRSGLVHRLDKNTTGVLMVARTLPAFHKLTDDLKNRTISREYEALVHDALISGSTVETRIGRHPRKRTLMAVTATGRTAVTHYRIKERFKQHTLLKINLETGRTHQIRVHMAHLQHPIVGDPDYGSQRALHPKSSNTLRACLAGFKRQALHACQLTLNHPSTNEPLTVQAPRPDDLAALLQALHEPID